MKSSLPAWRVLGERAHLADVDGVEFGEAVGLGQAHADELDIEALQIGENEELFDGGVIAHVAIERRVGIALLPNSVRPKRETFGRSSSEAQVIAT